MKNKKLLIGLATTLVSSTVGVVTYLYKKKKTPQDEGLTRWIFFALGGFFLLLFCGSLLPSEFNSDALFPEMAVYYFIAYIAIMRAIHGIDEDSLGSFLSSLVLALIGVGLIYFIQNKIDNPSLQIILSWVLVIIHGITVPVLTYIQKDD